MICMNLLLLDNERIRSEGLKNQNSANRTTVLFSTFLVVVSLFYLEVGQQLKKNANVLKCKRTMSVLHAPHLHLVLQ